MKTVEHEAKQNKDYKHIDIDLEFRTGQDSNHVDIEIIDDDNWEPDRDFFVQLFDSASSDQKLEGQDTQTRITIIDDD